LKNGLKVYGIAPYATRGLEKMSGVLLPTLPGGEAEVLGSLVTDISDAAEALKIPGSVILVGERLAASPGALSSAIRLAHVTGAMLAWVPRRAGERGAIEAGALPGLLPIGRPVTDPAARAEVARVWNVSELPAQPGRDTAQILAAAAVGELEALVIGGVDPYDLPDPEAVLRAIEATQFVVSLEQRVSAVTDRADVVLPVATVDQKAGTFVNWEGRGRPFDVALKTPGTLSDLRVLDAIASEMDVHLGLPGPDVARRELTELGGYRGIRPEAPSVSGGGRPQPEKGEALLSTWRLLLDAGRLQDGEPHLAGTAKAPVARLSAATALEIVASDTVTVSTARGSVTLPYEIVPDLPDRVVWLPANSVGCAVHRDLGVDAGAIVKLSSGGAA
jgi:NADH-quinone oxidoreductase subunit G